MRIKTFYAKTMSEAFREIKTHLGSDAVLLSTKEIPSRSGEWGRSSGFEVVAASDDTEAVDVYTGSGTRSLPVASETLSNPENLAVQRGVTGPGTYSPSKLAVKSAETEYSNPNDYQALPCNSDDLPEAAVDDEPAVKGKVASEVRRNLVENGVDGALARKLLSIAWEGLTPGQRRSRNALIRSISQAAISILPARTECDGTPDKKIVAFVGPTGVGKTTSIAKLAAHLALQKKKKVLLVTTDGYRIGAIDQLKTYAGLMGIPFRFVDQVPALVHTIEENIHRDYILIDTAGCSPRNLKAMTPLADFLRQSANMERHLVLSATTSSRDMRMALEGFELCGPDHLLFTKLDETTTPGPVLNEIVRTRKSFSYYCDGQRVPEDLHTLTGAQLIDLVINRNDVAFKD